MRYALSAVALIALVACSHSQPAAQPVAQAVAEPPPAPAPAPVAAPAPPPAPKPPPELAPASIYFDFERDELLPPARATLQAFFDQASQKPNQSIRIEGNCDERGTAEYNLALGQRRADAAKKYLINLGMPAGNIKTISYGKERPRAQGHDEEAWKENRRDDVIPTTDTSNAVSDVSR